MISLRLRVRKHSHNIYDIALEYYSVKRKNSHEKELIKERNKYGADKIHGEEKYE